jgi:hypothetical protein
MPTYKYNKKCRNSLKFSVLLQRKVAELSLLASPCWSIYNNLRILLHRFPWNFIMGTSTKICLYVTGLVKTGNKKWALWVPMCISVHILSVTCYIFTGARNILNKSCREYKTQALWPTHVFYKSYRFRDN